MMAVKKKKSLKLKLKKPVHSKNESAKKDEKDLRQTTMFDKEERDAARVREAAERIRRFNRPYSLTIGDLPTEKRADEATKGKMLAEVETDKKSVRVVKRLLPKHKLLTKLSSAKGSVRLAFEAMTYPYTVRGQRLFVFDDAKIDMENWSQEQIEKEMARQRTEFEGKIEAIVKNYRETAQEVADNWASIIEAAKAQLGELFDERDYLRAEEVVPHLYVDFGQEGVLEASSETRFMSSDLQGRDQQRMRDRFEAVVRLQEDVFITTFRKTVDQALKSISATNETGDHKNFHSTVMENLFGTFIEFRNKCLKYGMLSGTKVEETVHQCMKSLEAEDLKAEDAAQFIRKSDNRRTKAIEALTKASTEIAAAVAERASSRVIIRRVGGDD